MAFFIDDGYTRLGVFQCGSERLTVAWRPVNVTDRAAYFSQIIQAGKIAPPHDRILRQSELIAKAIVEWSLDVPPSAEAIARLEPRWWDKLSATIIDGSSEPDEDLTPGMDEARAAAASRGVRITEYLSGNS